jgi:hypothetical protein
MNAQNCGDPSPAVRDQDDRPHNQDGALLGLLSGVSTGLICGQLALQASVIPAKAGVQSVDSAFPKVCRMDSRFRGNDRRFVRSGIPKDTATPKTLEKDS